MNWSLAWKTVAVKKFVEWRHMRATKEKYRLWVESAAKAKFWAITWKGEAKFRAAENKHLRAKHAEQIAFYEAELEHAQTLLKEANAQIDLLDALSDRSTYWDIK